MALSRTAIITKIHLVISVIVVIPAAFVYGFNLGEFLDLNFITVDERSFSKSIMILYLGFATLWILGIFKVNFLKTALNSNTFFMSGLVIGRVLSLISDGLPSTAYILGVIGELILACYGFWVLNGKYMKKL